MKELLVHCCNLVLGAQNAVSVNSQDKPQPQQLHQGYHPSVPPVQSPYTNQPGISFYAH